jgi:hypothetical protein
LLALTGFVDPGVRRGADLAAPALRRRATRRVRTLQPPPAELARHVSFKKLKNKYEGLKLRYAKLQMRSASRPASSIASVMYRGLADAWNKVPMPT